MAPKLEIATATHSTAELAPIVAEYFGDKILVRSRQLFGGYSGCNYQIHLDDDSKYCLKISNGYKPQETELLCRTAHLLSTHGFQECCLPISKTDQTEFQFVSCRERNRVPACLLTFVDGKPADKVMRNCPQLATNILKGIGGGLARMHASVVIRGKEHAQQLNIRWYETNGGCCDVQDQVSGRVLAKMEGAKAVRNHSFVRFYKSELVELQKEMKVAQDMPLGITHGDPFADNILVDPETGNLSAFIDLEDVCGGPLLFDLACCAIGCCFDDNEPPPRLDFARLEALLEGYCKQRKLLSVEREHFVAFMKLTLLCNCSWRFCKFNVTDKDFPDEARDSYLELQRRIEYLHDPHVAQEITQVLMKQL